MRLSDLMPDRDSLVTRNYWWRRTKLGLPAPELAGPFAAEATTAKPEAVSSPAAQTNWDYAVIERLDSSSMKASLIPFDLGKLVLEHDASQDRELRPGDVITIFSQDDIRLPIDRQTKYVRLEGEFEHAGVYSVEPGETLRSVITRAGGLTNKAYLYGSVFSRKSTQALEQQRLNEYADRLEHQLERNSMALAGAATAAGPQTVAINRELIARIRRLRASGRIVLNLSPRSKGETDLPDMALEDGDRLVVPSEPATVQVVGAVYNQSAFLYRAGTRLEHYLDAAGGPSREADCRRMFVLRADGTVNSRDTREPIFASAFESLRLFPGDTVVVPEKNVRPSAMSQILAWTQFMSQFSLSALEVNFLK